MLESKQIWAGVGKSKKQENNGIMPRRGQSEPHIDRRAQPGKLHCREIYVDQISKKGIAANITEINTKGQ